MNANKKKIDKLNLEYGKNDEKIARLMERQREIEKQRTELENLDIVGMVRELGLSFEELAELINGEKAAAELSANVAETFDTATEEYATEEYAGEDLAEGGVWNG